MGTPVQTSVRGSIWLKLVFALAFVCAGLALAWMIVLPVAVADLVRRQTGCGAEIGSLYANPFTGHLVLKNLELTNPAAFPRKDFIQVREFEAEARPYSLVAGRRVIDRAMLDVATVTIVRDRQGRVNVRLLEHSPAGARPAAALSAPPPAGGILIRRLEVRLDRVVVADYAAPTPEVREYRLNFHHTYLNVTSARQLAEPLATALGNLGDAVDRVMPEWSGRLRRTSDRIEEAGRKTGEKLKGLFESLEKSLKK